jgi:hypothetical protein
MAASSKQTARAKGGALPPKSMARSSCAKAGQDTGRVGGRGEVGLPRKVQQMGGDERPALFEALRKKWLTDNEDRLLLAIKEAEKAIVWESLRHLYFAQEMSPFWNCWIEKGDAVTLKRFRRQPSDGEELSFPAVDPPCAAVLKNLSFPDKRWHDLDVIERLHMPKLIASNTQAVTPLRVSGVTFYGLMEWAYHQLKTCKKEYLPFDGLWGPIIERIPAHHPERSQVILEIDWSQGKQAIQKAFMTAIQPLLQKRFPNRRKARCTDSRHFFKGLVLLRRKECRNLPWGEATSIASSGQKQTQFIFGKGGRGDSDAARKALADAQSQLDHIKTLLADEEQRLCHGFDMKQWGRELLQNRKERLVLIPVRDNAT